MGRRAWTWVLFWMVPFTAMAQQPQDECYHYGDGSFYVTIQPHHERVIDEIITTIDKSATLFLGFQSRHLENLGESIREIGILQFLAYIFSEPPLHHSMRKIRASYFKWNGFVRNFAPRAEREIHCQSFFNDIRRFAQFFDLPPDPLVQYAKARDWDSFIGYLITNAN